MRTPAAVALLALVAPLPRAAAQDVPAPERFADARAKVAAEVEQGNAPSIAVAVLEAGEVVWAEGFGLADVAAGRKATADTIYRLASISKPFTATALMQLVERGLVDLDAPVNRYLDVPLRAYRGTADQITIRHLANHTGGLPTHWNFFYAPESPPPRAESIRRFGFAAFVPGTKTAYSNFAFGVLDHVIARVGKNPAGYRGWLVQELCDPLGMGHTDVGVRPGKEEHAALGYRKQEGTWVPVRDYGFDHDGASAVRSSARDLMRFARLQLEKGTVDGVRLLDEESVLAMREPRALEPAFSPYGVGWSTGTVRGEPVLRHSGGMPGVSTQLLVFPGLEAAVAVLANCADRGATGRALGAVLDVFLAREPPAEPAMESAAAIPRRATAGTFRGRLGDLPLVVELSDGDGASQTWGSTEAAPLAPARVRMTPNGPTLRWTTEVAGRGGDAASTLDADIEVELSATATGYAGVGYRTVDGVFRLPMWCELHREEPKPAHTLRVVTYNVLVGFQDSEVGRFLPGCQREAKIAAWLAAQQPDVTALQELNGFTEARLRSLAAAWGHPHVALLKEDGYPVGITSSAPLANVTRRREGLHHGMLRATTHGTDFVVVHFRPHPGIEEKLGEARQALELYREALAAGREAVVLGDFNCVAASDVDAFSAAALERYRRWRWALDGDRPAELALGPLLDAGAVDVLRATGGAPAELPLPRIDFVLASPGLAAACAGSRWLCDPEHLRWSDHPPVVADFAAATSRK